MLKQTYASRHLVSSDPEYGEMNRLQMMLCHAYNPHLAVQSPEMMDIDPVLIPSLIDTLKSAQGDLMEDGNWRDFQTAWEAP